MRLRARNLYEDEDQFEIIDAALKMYQASRKIKSIDL